MRHPAWRLRRENYPLGFGIQTRYRDQDLLAHINNVTIAEYFDDTRERMMRHVRSQIDPQRWVRVVTAEMSCSFMAEVLHPDTVDVTAGILRIGNSSFEIGHALFQNGVCASLCAATLVQSPDGKALPLSAELRGLLESLMISHGEG